MGLLALYRQKEILLNSSLKATKKKEEEEKLASVISKFQVSDQGHLGPLVFILVIVGM